MISIARFTRDNLKLSERQSAWAQLGVASVGIISIIIFPDFFVSLSILIAILYPLFLLYTYLPDTDNPTIWISDLIHNLQN